MSGIHDLQRLEEKLKTLTRQIHQINLQEKPSKTEPRRYTTKEVERMVGRAYRTILNAENLEEGGLPSPQLDANGRRLGYTLADINRARDYFGTRLCRADDEEPVVLSFQNFKGGSAKTTSSTHAAQYFAEAGARVLLIDCDPQASTTKTLGYAPDDDIEPEHTLLPLLVGDENELDYAIRSTYWDGLDLIPANLELFDAEYSLAAAESRTTALQRLRWGIESVWDRYDIIVLDPAPSLGLLSMSAMHAANAVIVTMPPAIYDVFSTRSFATMMTRVAEMLEKYLGSVDYKFVRLMVTRLDESSEIQVKLAEFLPKVLGHDMLRHSIRKTAALDRSGMRGRTVYEIRSSDTDASGKRVIDRRTLNRARAHFNSANEEILQLIRMSWPTHLAAMKDKGEI